MHLAELAVKEASRKGATEAEAYVEKAKRIQVEFSGDIESFKTVESLGMNLRVTLGRKSAMYATSISDENEVETAAAKAINIAKVAPEDPDWKHMNKRFGKASAEGYYDKTLETLDYAEIVDALTSAANRMESYDARVKPTRGFFVTSISKASVANNYNESAQRRETHIVIWMRTKAEEAGMKSTGTEHQEARFWKEIAFEDLAVKAAEKATKFLRARSIPGEKMPVILRNQVFANVLGVMLSGPLNADWVQKGRSPLSDKLGIQIASEKIDLIDDGIRRKGWHTKPFDDEGFPTQRTQVIVKGILRNYLYDSYTALKDNVESTGNAQRPYYWLAPQPAPNNLILKPGRTSPQDLIGETKRGIYVEDTIGEWLSNPVSGNLNATVTHGYLVESGELTDPIKGVVISGDFYEILRDGVAVIGDDLRNSSQNYAPTVGLSQLTVVGK